jgi:imidazole glycerol-phosphate synthase subunit HisH
MIALIDYGSGNLRSVAKALQHEGADVQLVSTPEPLADASAVVLPGVGAFGDCVSNLRQRNLWQPMMDWLDSGKPFLGVCVGLQMLFESSEEAPGVQGLGYFKGSVKRFSASQLKVPQIGWNSLHLTQPAHPLWQGLGEKPFFYFVHSYFAQPEEESIITATADYGSPFAAGVAKDNVAAVQFHPEKSQEAGLTLLRNFVAGTRS